MGSEQSKSRGRNSLATERASFPNLEVDEGIASSRDTSTMEGDKKDAQSLSSNKTTKGRKSTQLEFGGFTGVSIEFIRKFRAEHSFASGLVATTTADIFSNVISPSTQSNKTAYIENYKHKHDENLKPYTATATVLVLHAWSGAVEDTVAVIEQHSLTHPDAYYWLDLFSFNHHTTTRDLTTLWLSSYQTAIASLDSVLVVLSPWYDPIVLSRAWCILEILTAINATDNKNLLHFRFPQYQWDELSATARSDPKAVLDVAINFHVETTEAFQPYHQIALLSYIQQQQGFDTANATISACLQRFCIKALRKVSDEIGKGTEKEDGMSLFQIAFVLADNKLYDLARAPCERSIEILDITAGKKHPSTIGSVRLLGQICTALEDYKTAISVYQRAIDYDVATVGPDHPRSLPILADLAVAYDKTGDTAKAIELYSRTLDVYRHNLDPKSADVATLHVNMGVVFGNQGDYEKALSHYRNAVDVYSSTSGPMCQELVGLYTLIAETYYCMQNLERALEHHGKSLALTVARSGPSHPDAIAAYSRIGLVYSDLNDFDHAVEYFLKDLTFREPIVGKNHLSLLQTHNQLGIAFYHKRNKVKAKEHINIAHSIAVSCLGPEHPDTVGLAASLASF